MKGQNQKQTVGQNYKTDNNRDKQNTNDEKNKNKKEMEK